MTGPLFPIAATGFPSRLAIGISWTKRARGRRVSRSWARPGGHSPHFWDARGAAPPLRRLGKPEAPLLLLAHRERDHARSGTGWRGSCATTGTWSAGLAWARRQRMVGRTHRPLPGRARGERRGRRPLGAPRSSRRVLRIARDCLAGRPPYARSKPAELERRVGVARTLREPMPGGKGSLRSAPTGERGRVGR